MISLLNRVENTVGKEKMLVISIFSFSHCVFQSLLPSRNCVVNSCTKNDSMTIMYRISSNKNYLWIWVWYRRTSAVFWVINSFTSLPGCVTNIWWREKKKRNYLYNLNDTSQKNQNVYQITMFQTGPNWIHLQTTIYIWLKPLRSIFYGSENIVGKGEMLVTSIFSFSHNVFKSLLLHGC